MNTQVLCFVLVVGLFLLSSNFVAGKGGRGGGSRGSSSRGSSSRGSSSSSSTSYGSSSRGSNYGSSSSYGSRGGGISKPKPAPKLPEPPRVRPAPKAPEPPRVSPSAPELKEIRPPPSAPRVPIESNQPPYNPNYGQGSRNQPGVNPAQLPSYPGSNAGQHPGALPPYPGSSPGQYPGAPVPYPGSKAGQYPGAPPPYPGPNQQRPPPYDTQAMPPQPGFRPEVGNQPYPRQPGIGNQPYPQQPGIGNPTYPRQPGTGAQNYPHMNQPYPRQPGVAPYPQQPGGIYGPPPIYTQHSGLPMGSTSYTKPYKKKGLLGQVFSFNKGGSKVPKQPKYGAYGSSFGVPHSGGSSMPHAMYPMMPMTMKIKKHKIPKFGSGPSFVPVFLPSYHHHHYYHHQHGQYSHDINNQNYQGGCRKPLQPANSSMDCDFTTREASCKVQCEEGYSFADNATAKESKCWHIGGVWKPSRHFPECIPICKGCLNGGICKKPGGACFCDASYRGEHCEHHISSCDIIKLAGKNSWKLTWICQHIRNETVCTLNCRPDSHFLEEPQSRVYRCTVNGTWTPDAVPECVLKENATIAPLLGL